MTTRSASRATMALALAAATTATATSVCAQPVPAPAAQVPAPAAQVPTGAIPTGAIPAGAIPTGAIPTGAIPTGAIPTGAIPTGAIPTGAIPTGAIPTGAIPTGAIPTGAGAPTAPTPGGTVPPPPGEAPPPEATTAPVPQGPRTAIVDAAPLGVDAAAAHFVTETVRTAVAQLGFSVIPTSELYDAARRLALPFPVPPDGIFLLERALQAPVAITAEVRAAHRLYVVRLRVRVAVEPMERVRDVAANQWQLGEAIRSALPALLVPPQPGMAAQIESPPEEVPLPALPPRRHYRAHPRHWELGGGLDVAFGPGQDSFINYLVEARLGWFPMDRLGFTLTGAYGNLRGRQGRVSNFLTTVGVETSVDLVPASHIFIPLRAEVGYLPNNGPVFRVSAGLAFQLSRRVRLEVDILSPTLWVLPETSPVTLDVAATLHYGL